jgi:hypothetical protein
LPWTAMRARACLAWPRRRCRRAAQPPAVGQSSSTTAETNGQTPTGVAVLIQARCSHGSGEPRPGADMTGASPSSGAVVTSMSQCADGCEQTRQHRRIRHGRKGPLREPIRRPRQTRCGNSASAARLHAVAPDSAE